MTNPENSVCLTESQALAIIDRLKAEGFVTGFDCAAVCLDGYYSQRSRRWGEPKSKRWGVSLTVLDDKWEAARRALGEGFADANRGQTYWIYGWKLQFNAGVVNV